MSFIGDCIKSATCCFPRAYAWLFQPRVMRHDDTTLTDTVAVYGVDAAAQSESVNQTKGTPQLPGYGQLPADKQSDWVVFSGSANKSFGIRADGSLWGWGKAPFGNGSMEDSSIPVLVNVGPWKHVSTSDSHTLAIKRDGTLWAFGDNSVGQLGTNKTVRNPNSFFLNARARLSTSILNTTVFAGGVYEYPPTVSLASLRLPSADYSAMNFGTRASDRDGRGLPINSPPIDFAGGSGATFTTQMNWVPYSAEVTDGGSGYVNAPKPTLVFTGTERTTATATVTVSFSAVSVQLMSAGVGYTSAPDVLLSRALSAQFKPGSGFSATATVSGGSVTSVVLNSGGSGHEAKLSLFTDTPHYRDLSLTTGGGTGCVVRVMFGQGTVTALSYNDGSGRGTGSYSDKPTGVIFSGGGGTGAAATVASRGSVTGVSVVNAGSGYTAMDPSQNNYITNTESVGRFLFIAFDRQQQDTLSGPANAAMAVANLTPATVSEILPSERRQYPPWSSSTTDVFSSVFDARSGTVGAFYISNAFTIEIATGAYINDGEYEARIVGGGKGWDQGVSVGVEVTSVLFVRENFGFNEYRVSVSLRFEGSADTFAHQPYVQLKSTQRRKITGISREESLAAGLFSNVGPLSIEKVKSGTTFTSYLMSRKSGTEFKINEPIVYQGGSQCQYTGCDGHVYGIDNDDPFSEWNAIPGLIRNRTFSITGYGFTGSPPASLTSGDGELSFLKAFEGSLVYTVSNPGTSYRNREPVISSSSHGTSKCIDGSYRNGTYTYEVTSSRYIPELARVSPYWEGVFETAPSITYRDIALPAGVWTGPPLPEAVLYATFKGGGCWKLTRQGNVQLSAGTPLPGEPEVRVHRANFSPFFEQIPGTWKFAYAEGNYAYHRTQGNDTLSQGALSFAISGTGELFRWGHPGVRYVNVGGITFTTDSDLLPSYPEPIGRPVEISCQWNEDTIPSTILNGHEFSRKDYIGQQNYGKYGDWTLRSAVYSSQGVRVIDSPQASRGIKAGSVLSIRRCSEPKFYPDSLPNSFFGFTGDRFSSDEKSGLGTVSASSDYAASEFLQDFTGPPVTFFNPGLGYTSAPKVHFSGSGNPLLSVSSRLLDVPSFEECNSSFARSSDGQLWSLFGGHTIVADSPVITSRKAEFSASPLIDSWSPGWYGGYPFYFGSPGYRVIDVPDWADTSLQEGYSTPSLFNYGSPTSRQMSPVTHSTKESITAVRAFAIVLEDGGEGFDDYSQWSLKVFSPPTISYNDQGYYYFSSYGNTPISRRETTWSGPNFKTEVGFNENAYNRALKEQEAHYARVAAGCYTNPPPPPQVSRESYESLPTEWRIRSSVSHLSESEFIRTPRPIPAAMNLTPWRGSLIPSPLFTSGYEYFVPHKTTVLISGVFDINVPPTVEFQCVQGNSSYTKLPSYKIIPIGGIVQRTEGLAKLDGVWSDFSINAGSRKLYAEAFPGFNGFSAPPAEQGFVKFSGEVGLKSDGSLWRVGRFNLGPSRVMGNLKVKVVNPGKGYRSAVTAQVAQLPGVATATATLNASLSVVGVENGGSGYRTPPTLSISGGGSAVAVISGPVESAEVLSGGSGYRSPPTVRFSAPGMSAFATAKMTGSVVSVAVASGGDGYTKAPGVVFSGAGSGASATASIRGRVESIAVLSGGLYDAQPEITFSGGGGSGAEAVAILSGNGPLYSVSAIILISGGSNYTSAPVVTIAAGVGSTATATATINARIISVSVTDGGSGYNDHPDVSFSGPSRTPATAASIASLSVDSIDIVKGGKYRASPTATFIPTAHVDSLTLSSGGSGYTSAPEVLIAGGVGSGAEAICSIAATVTRIDVLRGGSGYSSEMPPRIELVGGFDAGTGVPAKATAVVNPSTGAIQSISVANAGSIYRSTPTVRILPPERAVFEVEIEDEAITEVRVVSGGFGYSVPPRILFNGGDDAEATATLDDNGCVSSVSVTKGGSGYGPSATASPAPFTGGRAAAAAVISGVVDSIQLTKSGARYDALAPPRVLFIGGGGTGATSEPTIATSGSGGNASTKIDGTVIYATITNPGSGYSSVPEVSVSGGGNERLAEADRRLADGEINQEEHLEITSALSASFVAGIRGQVASVQVNAGGENYLPNSVPSQLVSRSSGDIHGKRINTLAVFRGGRSSTNYTYYSDRNIINLPSSGVTVSSQSGGGGEITQVANPSSFFSAVPSVHFANTVGVSVQTRAKVSCVAIAHGSPLSQARFNIRSQTLSLQGFYPFLNNTKPAELRSSTVADSPGLNFGAHRDADRRAGNEIGSVLAGDGGQRLPQALCYGTVHYKGISPSSISFVFTLKWFPATDPAFNRKVTHDPRIVRYLRAPVVVVESELGAGASTNIAIDSNGLLTPNSGLLPQYPAFTVAGQTSEYASDLVGRVTVPGIVDFIPPVISLAIANGKVVSATIGSLGNIGDFIYATSALNLSEVFPIIVHGGGGRGASVKFDVPSDSATPRVVVVEGGQGYTSAPSAFFAPRVDTVYGHEHRDDPQDWVTHEVGSGVTAMVEYATGSTGDGYITLTENSAITDGGTNFQDSWGLTPLFKDGFVSNAFLTDGGQITETFYGPAFIKNYTSSPQITLSSHGESASASVVADVVNWTSVFDGLGNHVLAVEDEW